MTSFDRWVKAFNEAKKNPNGRNANGEYLALVEERARLDVALDVTGYKVSFEAHSYWPMFKRLYL